MGRKLPFLILALKLSQGKIAQHSVWKDDGRLILLPLQRTVHHSELRSIFNRESCVIHFSPDVLWLLSAVVQGSCMDKPIFRSQVKQTHNVRIELWDVTQIHHVASILMHFDSLLIVMKTVSSFSSCCRDKCVY